MHTVICCWSVIVGGLGKDDDRLRLTPSKLFLKIFFSFFCNFLKIQFLVWGFPPFRENVIYNYRLWQHKHIDLKHFKA